MGRSTARRTATWMLAVLAAAFSGHRFRETYDHLAPDIVWVAAGGSTTEGKDGVISTCEETLAELANTTTEFTRFLTVADQWATVST